ncbi:glutamate synthase [Rhodovulum sulfidophilum]|uniref:Glutamate synthase n=1 Tax=Rhodovulum sulfidophilum TaxID=35806 RepID=A0A0D6AY33_RHOSU|nr:glutamate synthase [Rhodovulum sulfidophilum]
MKRIVTAGVFYCVASMAEAEVPTEVIDECNEVHAASYNNMPECLKEGVVAHEMLETALSDDFYGPGAQRVIDGCRERNDTYEKVWICFENAAEQAVETRRMIGGENIKDACFASISDPSIYDRIVEENKKARRKHIREEYFYGGQMYFPFKGCPQEDQTAEEPTNSGNDGKDDGLSAQACSAYRDFEQVLSSNSTADLETAFSAAESLPEDERFNGILALGVSQSSIEFLKAGDEKEAMGTAFILAALMNKHHPDMLKRFMESGEMNSNPNLDALGDQMILGLLSMALVGYEEQCAE